MYWQADSENFLLYVYLQITVKYFHMHRRKFITSTALLSLGLGQEQFITKRKTHVLTLSFDDGFKKSFYKIADIHDEYGLKACFNVIAMGHVKGIVSDKYIVPHVLGDFNDWNKLKSRGHEIMPHSWDHQKLTDLPLTEAKENIDKCLDYFEKNLDGYKAQHAVYNFAYNASNQELHDHVLEKVRALRTGGRLILGDNKYHLRPNRKTRQVQLGCWAYGPENGDQWMDNEINTFLASDGGWLILNLHGLDDEGWGPLSTRYLDSLLKRLSKIKNLEVLPAGMVLK